MATNQNIGKASVQIDGDTKGLFNALDQTDKRLDKLVADARAKTLKPRIDNRELQDKLQSGFSGIQSQLSQINFSQFLTASMSKGALSLKDLNWGGIGTGIGFALGGPLGAALGSTIGGVIDSANERIRNMRQELESVRPASRLTGFSQADLSGLQRISGLENLDRVSNHFARARDMAVSGSREMRQAFETLGIDPTAEPRLEAYAAAFQRLNRVQRAAVQEQLFGDRGGQAFGAALATPGLGTELERNRERFGGGGADEIARRAAFERAMRQAGSEANDRRTSQHGVLGEAYNFFNGLGVVGVENLGDRFGRAREAMEFNRRQDTIGQITPEEARRSGQQLQAGRISNDLIEASAQLREVGRLGRDMTSAEQRIWDLRRQGAGDAIVAEAEREAAANRLLAISNNVNRQFEDVGNRFVRDRGDLFQAAQDGSIDPAVFARAFEDQLSRAESGLHLDDPLRNANAMLEGSREAIIASQSRFNQRPRGDDWGERQLRVAEAALAEQRRATEAFNRNRLVIGAF